ncbi:glycosyltransferase family 1 protein [Gabonibacter chumensis]|uniref:glycosyltransferase family 1 protein n=1 Tax=Gabonibacter chumensis TaxID=2972474 RepID=UPI002573C943|nr:glycosyltransferase family 1 protein [Gabonibacter chumensis]MCR9013038.1 glycosyltransferase family 1 protein [Gabonibacter chumensis]
MKMLFLIFHGFAAYNGISKKIFYQKDALQACGWDVRFCYLDLDSDAEGCHIRRVEETIIDNYGKGWIAKIKKRTAYNHLYRYILENDIRFVYMRYDHNANPFLIRFLKKLRRKGIKTVAEIPTYPYDQEYNGLALKEKLMLYADKCFRESMAKQLFRIVTFSGYTSIWHVPAINISNGIDFNRIKLKTQRDHTPQVFHLTGVADMHRWHGYDRIVAGMVEYYKQPRDTNVYLHLVGGGMPDILNELHQMVTDHHLEEKIFFHGPVFGEELDSIFEQTDMGVASLARHRSQISKIKTLKNREYAARGIPFVYSETDEDFDRMPYIMKAPADDSPINIQSLVDFWQTHRFTPAEIRSSIEPALSWTQQMQKITDVVTSSKTEP